MENEENNSRSPLEKAAAFRTTHWSVVLKAGQEDGQASMDALERLCRAYWHPIYAFVRRSGQSPEQAQDIVQGFFSALLRRKGLERVDPAKGKFRSFLLASVNNFMSHERKKAETQKRGGGCEFISLNAEAEEARYLQEPGHNLTPERLYEQRWANAILARVHSRLEQEFQKAGHQRRFEILKSFLSGYVSTMTYAGAAQNLGLSESAVTSIIHRMRLRYRELLTDEIAQTVQEPSEIEDEIRHLVAALSPS